MENFRKTLVKSLKSHRGRFRFLTFLTVLDKSGSLIEHTRLSNHYVGGMKERSLKSAKILFNKNQKMFSKVNGLYFILSSADRVATSYMLKGLLDYMISNCETADGELESFSPDLENKVFIRLVLSGI